MAAVKWPKLVLFGDSLTQFSFSDGGWGARVADAFQRRCDVLNRGFSGYTSDFNNILLPALLKHDITPSDAIAAVVILLGSNDAVLPGTDDRAATVESYVNNLHDIIEQFLKHGLSKSKVVIMTPPAVVEDMWALECTIKGREMNIFASRVSLFANACAEVGSKLDIDVVDIHNAMQKEKNWERLLDDGLHFSREGNEFVASQLLPVLTSKLQSLPMIFPDYKDIDGVNPRKSLAKYLLKEN